MCAQQSVTHPESFSLIRNVTVSQCAVSITNTTMSLVSRPSLRLMLLLLLFVSCNSWPTPSPEISPNSTSEVTVDQPPQANVTKKNPIKQLVKDVFTLYDAVRDFVSPWFGDTSKQHTTPQPEEISTTEPQFNDFEDPGTSVNEESRRLEDIASETFLRYVRSAENTTSFLREIWAETGLNGTSLTRIKRDIFDGNDVYKWFLGIFMRQVRALWQEHGSDVMRYSRQMWESHGTSLLRETRDVLSGTSPPLPLLTTLVRHVRDLTEKIVGSERVTTLIRNVRQVQEGRQNIFQGYYDFIINEYSYKFWAVYMLASAALLTYSAIAAIYYSKFNTSAIDYELYDDFARSNDDNNSPTKSNPLGLVGSLVSVRTFQNIMDAISSKKFS